MCIVVGQGDGGNSRESMGPIDAGVCWQGKRSVEILSYQFDRRRVDILFCLLLVNKVPGSYLGLMHPGNSCLDVVCPWHRTKGFARHSCEPNSGPGILGSVYGQMFQPDEEKGGLRLVAKFNPAESLVGLALEEQSHVYVWSADAARVNEKTDRRIRPLYNTDKHTRFVPFTTWKLGPFLNEGLVLVCFKISFEGDTFRRLIESRDAFPVDGPKRLCDRISLDFIPDCDRSEQKVWDARLAFFRRPLLSEGDYDVILYNEGSPSRAVRVNPLGSCEVKVAAADRQPIVTKGSAIRFLTMGPRFRVSVERAVPTPQTIPASRSGGRHGAYAAWIR